MRYDTLVSVHSVQLYMVALMLSKDIQWHGNVFTKAYIHKTVWNEIH